MEYINDQIHVKKAEDFEHVRYEDAVSKIKSILLEMNQWSLNQETLESVKIYVDASAPEFIRSLKVMVGENDNPQYLRDKILWCKQYDRNLAGFMTVIPVPFGSGGGKDLLLNAKSLLEYQRPLIGIHPKFDKLITALRTAVSDDKGNWTKNLQVMMIY